MKNKMHTLIITDSIEKDYQKFLDSLKEGEEVVTQSLITSGDGPDKIIIITKESNKKTRNLLLEELDKNRKV